MFLLDDTIITSLSFLCLFVVLVWYHETPYCYMMLLISVLAMWLPVLYLLPYMFVVCHVFMGKNSSTDRSNQTLYIGQYTEYEDIDIFNLFTSSHWVVVVQENDNYTYSLAVGPVVLGKGEKRHFRKMTEELRKKYQLTEVGFVTRDDRSDIVDNEVMRSRYSRQEHAIGMAFQISSSRTYTLVKTMMLRVRTVILLYLMVVWIILYVFSYEIAKFINPAVLINLFVAVELSRIGRRDTEWSKVWPFIMTLRPTLCSCYWCQC